MKPFTSLLELAADALSFYRQEVAELTLRQERLEMQMSDFGKQVDRLQADVPVLTQQLADEDTKLQADETDLASARQTISDLQAQRDQVAASDAAEAARLQGQIDALEKLIKVATPDAGATPDTSGSASADASGTPSDSGNAGGGTGTPAI